MTMLSLLLYPKECAVGRNALVQCWSLNFKVRVASFLLHRVFFGFQAQRLAGKEKGTNTDEEAEEGVEGADEPKAEGWDEADSDSEVSEDEPEGTDEAGVEGAESPEANRPSRTELPTPSRGCIVC